MIIGLSGAQGGGKSSLLNELQTRGYTVDAFRVSRAVQAELGWESLDRVMDSPDTMMAFQDEVFNQKLKNDIAFAKSDEVILTERTFADIYAYTATWTYKFIDSGSLDVQTGLTWLTGYSVRCEQAQADTYKAALLLPMMSHVVFENDPHRAKQEDVEVVYERIEDFCVRCSFKGVRRFFVTEKSIADRATQVEGFIKQL